MGSVRKERRGVIALGIVLAGVVLAWGPGAYALDPALDVSQYAHTEWTAGAGLTTGKINAIAQTPDGYLWLGTDFGLFRFDGVRAVQWRPPAGQQLPSNSVSSLYTSRDGTLWIGTLKGPASWKDGRLKEYPELAGFYVVRILEDREAAIWMSGADPLNGKVCWLHSGTVTCWGENAGLGSGAFGLYEDSQGKVWAGAVSGLWLWKPGPPRLYPLTGEMFGVEALGEDNEGALLVGWKGGIRRFNNGKIETYPLHGVGQFTATCILRDRDGGLWIGTRTEGLVHFHQGKTDVFAPSEGLSGASVQNIFEDREGSLWVVTGTGLDRFNDFAVTTFTAGQGLSRDLVSSVLADRDGSVWVATYGGLDRWRDGGIRPWGKREGKLNGLDPTSLLQDRRGQIWVSTNRDFGYLEGDRFVPISGFPGGIVDGIAEDSSGDLWVSNRTEGLIHLSRNRVVEEIPWTSLGHKDSISPTVKSKHRIQPPTDWAKAA
jgi:ligand-binding sensor domain-containing protein